MQTCAAQQGWNMRRETKSELFAIFFLYESAAVAAVWSLVCARDVWWGAALDPSASMALEPGSSRVVGVA